MHVYDYPTYTDWTFADAIEDNMAHTLREVDARAIGRREYPGSKLSELAYETAFAHPSIVWC